MSTFTCGCPVCCAEHDAKSARETTNLQRQWRANIIAMQMTAAMDNVDASRIGCAASEALSEKCGDSIDAGLRVRRLLEEAGFIVIKKKDL